MMSELSQVRLCITGSFGYGDIGDEAMLTEDLDFVLSELGVPRGNITLIGHEPEYVSWYHEHPRELCMSSQWYRADHERPPASGLIDAVRARAGRLRRSFSPEVRAVRRSDLLLIIGGGTINSRDAIGGSITRMHSLVMSFKNRGVPVFMCGQTIGPLGLHPRHNQLATEILSAVDYLSVRDTVYSREYMDALGCFPPVFVETLDDAACLAYEEEHLPDEVYEFLADGLGAAVNVTDYTADTPEKLALVTGVCVDLVRARGLKVVLVSHARSDRQNLGLIREMLPEDVMKRTLLPDTRRWRAGTLKRMIASCRVAVGGRYHFVVFAATANVPFVAMSGSRYSYIKNDGFARQVGLSHHVLSEKASADPSEVRKAITKALDSTIDIKSGLERPSRSMLGLKDWLESRGLLGETT